MSSFFRKILIVTFSLFSIPFVSFAQTGNQICSSMGYTIETINGVFTDDVEAKENKDNLKKRLPGSYNGEALFVDYLLNPSHLGGLGDIAMSVVQKAFEDETVKGYDLVEMLGDASQKIKTQKLLLVAHSQGNFYANSFYDVVAGQPGGVPVEAISVYSVANPASRVAGGGKWITSDTDKVIAGVVASVPFKKIMAPNTHIALQQNDSAVGHGFSDVYLKYRSSEIVAGIQSSLDNLSSDPERREDTLCIDPPKLSLIHKTQGVILAVLDPAAKVTVDTAVLVGATSVKLAKATTHALFVVASALYGVAEYAVAWTADTEIAIAKGVYGAGAMLAKAVINTATAVGSKVYVVTKAMLNNTTGNSVNNNSASVILATQTDTQTQETKTQTVFKEVIEGSQPATPVTPSSPELLLTAVQTKQESLPEQSSTEAQAPSVEATLPETKEEILFTESVAVTTPVVSYGGGGGGGSSPAPEVPETPSDTMSPVISILGDNPATTTVNTVYVDAGATASDVVDGVVAVNTTSDVDITHVGVYTVTYVAFDLSHNTATSTRTVNVIDITESTTTPDFNTNGDVDAKEDDVVDTSPTPVLTYTYSDLNTNGIADATEDGVVATSTMSLPAGEYHFHNLTIINNATLFLGGDTATSTSASFLGVKIVADNITVSAGAAISANGRGYNISGTSPGSPSESNYSRGANYGGIGLVDMKSAPYGSATHPTDMGSGSRYCCTDAKGGGGAIHLVVAGILTNNGVISADGGPSGSGGSVYVETSTLAGTGDFRANGGSSELTSIQYYPGAGGRVAAYYQTSSFLGKVETLGGCSSFDSGRTMTCGDKGTTGLFDTTTNDLYINSSWSFQKNDEPFQFNRIILAEGASVTMDDAVTVVANELLLQDKSSFVSSVGSSLSIPKIVIDGGALTLPESTAPPVSPILSSKHTITALDVLVEAVTVSGVVDETAHTVSLTVPFGTDARTLTSSVAVSALATSSPASGTVQDFTNPVTFTVTAEDGSTQEYIVTVTVAPDTEPPTIVSYTFNGTAADIVADFATTTPAVALIITASENVDWVSIKIEDQNNPDNYKTFFSGAGCVDDTAVCAKSWTGALSHGADTATTSTYRVKVKMEDAAGNPYQDYLSPYSITVSTATP